MIDIKVGGKPLYIPEDTSVVLEQHNYTLSEGNLAADIVWTFEVPASPNMATLGFEGLMHISGQRRYDCELSINGVVFARGDFYVQSSTNETRIECGVVANAFGVGFGDKMLCENDYGDDITIASSEAGHQTGWENFLLGSLTKESIYKFMLFADEDFCSDNEDFGYFDNKLSGLMNNYRQDQFTKYVNRLFFSADGSTIYNNGDGSAQGVRLFNKTHRNGKMNGYHFAPALRLDWLVRRVLGNAGLKASGTFFADKRIHNLFSQSLNAMDGDVFQYGVDTWLKVNGTINTFNSEAENILKFKCDVDNDSHTAFGWNGSVGFSFRLLLPSAELTHETNEAVSVRMPSGGYWGVTTDNTDEVYALLIGPEGATKPNIRMKMRDYNDGDSTNTKCYMYGTMPDLDTLAARAGVQQSDVADKTARHVDLTGNGQCRLYYKQTMINWSTHSFRFYEQCNSMLVQLTYSESKPVYFTNDLGGYTEGCSYPLWHNASWGANTRLIVQLVKCKVSTLSGEVGLFHTFGWTNVTGAYLSIPEKGDLDFITNYEVQETINIDTTDEPLNIFSNILSLKEHVPNLSNGEFLSQLVKLFGINLYTNGMTKEVQLSFFKDLHLAQSFDISAWVTKRERLEYEPKRYELTITPTLGTKDIAGKNVLKAVLTKETLPPASTRKNKHAYVENEKAYRRSEKVEGTSRYKWQQAGGDGRSLVAGVEGADDIEEVSINIGMPNMRWVDVLMTDKYICEVGASGCSSMMEEDYDGKFDMVLMQYRGKRSLPMQEGSAVATAYIEDANPTIYDGNGNIVGNNYLNLSAVGEQSIGEIYMKSLYNFLGNQDKYRITAVLPTHAFLRVMALLQPQQGVEYQQERWIQVMGGRYLPITISYEFNKGNSVLATIECARLHQN